MKIYVDWGITKEWFYVRDNSDIVESVPFEKFLELVDSNTEIYLETGVPKERFLKPLLEKGCKVNLVRGSKIKEKREKEGIEKSDKNDTLAIRDFVNNGGRIIMTLESVEDLENLKFKFYAKQHDQLNKTITRLKNTAQAYLIEYGESPLKFLPTLEREKIRIEKVLEKIFKVEIGLFKDINGIGTITVAKAMLFSNPKKFPSLRKYLCYIGFNESVKYTRNGKLRKNPKRTPFYLMAEGVIKAKDEKWYNQYLKIKEDLKAKFPDDGGWLIDAKAKNRLATLLAKEFYRRIKNQKTFQGRL